MALKWWSGFDLGRAPSATGNTGREYADVVATPAVVDAGGGDYWLSLTGTNAIRNIELTGSNLLGGSVTAVVISFPLLFPSSLPSNSPDLICFGSEGFFFFQAAGTKLGAAFAGESTVDGPVVVADVPYWIDLYYDVSANPWRLRWWVNGVQQTDVTSAQAASTVSGLTIGRVDAVSGTYRYNDVRVSVTAGDAPLGQGIVKTLLPDTGATATEIGTADSICRFTSNGGGLDTTFNSANILAAISEIPPVISASATGLYQRTSGTGNAINIPMTSYTLQGGETIEGVVVRVLGWAASATANNLELRAYDGNAETTLIAREDPNFDNSTSAPVWWCAQYTPSGGWDQTKLDNFALRIGYSNDVNPVVGAHLIVAELAIKRAPVAPSAVAAVASIPAVTVSTGGAGDATAAPAVVAATATAPGPTLSTGSTVDGAVVAATATIPAASAAGGSTPTPSTIAAVASVGAATVNTGSTISASTVTAVAAVAAATPSTGSTAAPTTIGATAAVGSVTFTSSANPAPAAVAAVATVPSPSIQASSTVPPTTVAGIATVPTPVPSTGSTVPATTVDALTDVPAASVSAGGNTTVNPTAVVATATVETATASASSTAATPTVEAITTVDAPSVSVGSTVSPAVVQATTAVSAGSPSTGVTLTLTTVAGVAAIANPTVMAGASPAPSTVAGITSVGSPALTTGAIVSAQPVTAVTTIAAPAIATPTAVITRPETGTISRPSSGAIPRPDQGTVTRP